jgi:hypothetical protein
MNQMVIRSLQYNWTWKRIVKSLKDKHKTILKMEWNLQGLQKPHIRI